MGASRPGRPDRLRAKENEVSDSRAMKAKKRFSDGKRKLALAGPLTLRRDLGLLDAVGIGFGAIIGAGIFVVTGIAAVVAGSAFLFSLSVTGVSSMAKSI